MEVSTSHQIYVFSLFVVLGMVCGAFFDVQRFLRKISFAGDVRTMLEDILFVTFFTAVTLGASLYINNGEIRYYEVMGAVSGVLFYAAVLSRIFLKILSTFLKMAENLLIKPLVKILRFLVRPINKTARTLKKCAARLRRNLKSIRKSAKKRKKLIKKRVKML